MTAGPASSKKAKVKAKKPFLPRHGNRSIVAAVSLLRFLASAGRPLTLTEIAFGTGMSTPRAHRYLLGLADSRLVEQNAVSGLYDLGSEVVELGVAALGKVDAVRFASEVLAPLVDETGSTALLTMWGANGPTVICCEQAGLASAVRVREGRKLSLLRSASGHIFLAYLSQSETGSFVERELALPRNKRMAANGIEALQADVRRRGLARGLGDETPNIAALAAPVFGTNGKLVLCIGLISAIGFDTRLSGRPAVVLKRVASDLSRRLGSIPNRRVGLRLLRLQNQDHIQI